MSTTHGSHASYYLIFAALLVLTGVTTGVAYIDLGGLNNFVAMGIAATKAALVVGWFMHVRYSSALVGLTIAAGLFWLAILAGITFADYLSRSW